MKFQQIDYSKFKCTNKQSHSVCSLNQTEDTHIGALIHLNEKCINALHHLTDLHEKTMSIINLQLAIDALESNNLEFGIEMLRTSAQMDSNAAALYDLGICYERGIGVEHDRAKVSLCFLFFNKYS